MDTDDEQLLRAHRKKLLFDLETLPTCAYDRSHVQRLLPHRDPILLVDAITHCDPSKRRIAGLRRVRGDDPVFAGHFPGQPIYPGCLVIESAGQAALCMYGISAAAEGNAPNTAEAPNATGYANQNATANAAEGKPDTANAAGYANQNATANAAEGKPDTANAAGYAAQNAIANAAEGKPDAAAEAPNTADANLDTAPNTADANQNTAPPHALNAYFTHLAGVFFLRPILPNTTMRLLAAALPQRGFYHRALCQALDDNDKVAMVMIGEVLIQ